jgi:Fur family ferric uptake transcriptional regulator
MQRDDLDLTRLRPTGGKHSSKRDQILRIFLQQEGHLSADDLFDLVRLQAPGIGRATVYRTLQWMVEAGIARKVDFGEGRSRYEPSYGHPRHFHLICSDCHRSSEFLSSDIETLVEEVAAAREFRPTQTLCRSTGLRGVGPARRHRPIDGATTERVFAGTPCASQSRPNEADLRSTRAQA